MPLAPLPTLSDLFYTPPVAPQDLTGPLSALLKNHSQQWTQALQTLLDSQPENVWNAKITEWMHTHHSQWRHFVQFLCDQIWSSVTAIQAMPAHDMRHAILKTPLRALQYIDALQALCPLHKYRHADNYLTLGLLGALCHDWGRWAEERVLQECGHGMTHARLSAALFMDTLRRWQAHEKTQIPLEIKWFVVNAIANHTAGASAADPLPLQIVVRSDRDQLYGPEIIMRNIHHCPQSNGAEHHFLFSHPDFPAAPTTFQKMEKFNTTRLQGPLHILDPSVRSRETVLERFLLLTSFSDSQLQKLHVDHAPDLESKKNLQQQLLQQLPEPAKNLSDTITELISQPGCAKSPKYTQGATSKFTGLSTEVRHQINKVLTWILSEQQALDADDLRFINHIMAQYPADSATHYIAQRIRTGLTSPHGTSPTNTRRSA